MKILVVEDNPRHLEDAIRVLQEAGVEVVTAVNADGLYDKAYGIRRNAEEKCYVPLVDGVITDIFLPRGYGGEKFDNSDYPFGLVVAASMWRAKIPFVFCTEGYHHGVQYQWIDDFAQIMGWSRMVDTTTPKGEKHWREALELLQQQIK